MTPPRLAHHDDLATVWHGDALDVLAKLPDAIVHAAIVDPPYGLAKQSPKLVADVLARWVNGERDYVPGGSGLNGARWDRFAPPPALWDQVLRVLKPGGHLLCFAAPRTQDLMGVSIRLAGFEIRDSLLAWVYGSGFPKAQDLSRMIDREDGATRAASAPDPLRSRRLSGQGGAYTTSSGWRAGGRHAGASAPASERSAAWEGWAGALKPAQEPVLMARKPLDGTLAHNVVTHGAGALHIDAVRVPRTAGDAEASEYAGQGLEQGRWPPNLLVAHHPDCLPGDPCAPGCVLPDLEAQSGDLRGRGTGARSFPVFHYAAKASAAERPTARGGGHLTVKPMSLMAWLLDLVAAPGMVVLDPCAGSGTLAEVAVDAGVRSISIERDEAHIPLILERVARAQARRDVAG